MSRPSIPRPVTDRVPLVPPPWLAKIPGDLLDRHRARSLVRWLERRYLRPSLWALELERHRRGLIPDPRRQSPPRRPRRRKP